MLTIAELPEFIRIADKLLQVTGSNMEKETKMSTAIDSIKRGLLEAIEHAEGRAPQTRIHRPRPVDVKALRNKVSMTQEQFAARFGFSTATLRHWERGDRAPQGPALVLLNVIDHNPNAVIEALAA
jgi:putative transcriptional regulator